MDQPTFLLVMTGIFVVFTMLNAFIVKCICKNITGLFARDDFGVRS